MENVARDTLASQTVDLALAMDFLELVTRKPDAAHIVRMAEEEITVKCKKYETIDY